MSGLYQPTITAQRQRTVRRFAEFTGAWPWQWRATHLDAWVAEGHWAHSTIRSYEGSIAAFMDYVRDPRYGWTTECQRQVGEVPIQICHEGNRSAPERPLGRVLVTGGRRATVDIHLIWGHPHVIDHDIDGNAKPIQLDRIRTLHRTSKTRHRYYNEYTVPDRFGGGTIRLRLTSDDTVEANEFNREEHLRAISRLDPDNARIYGRRNDTEALTSLLDSSLPNGRAHSVSVAGIFMDLIALRAWRNAVALDGLSPPGDAIAA